MRRILLSTGLITAALTAQAQALPVPTVLNPLNGALMARNSIREIQAVKASEVVTRITYAGKTFPQRRTPPAQLPARGGASVTQLESFLQQCYTVCRADSITEIIPFDQYSAYAALRRQVQAIPLWRTTFYDEEMTFYQQQDHLRRARRQQLAQPPRP